MKIHRDVVVGLVCIALSTAVLLVTPGFPGGTDESQYTGPAFFPNLLAILYILLGLYEVAAGFMAMRRGVSDELPKAKGRRSSAERRSFISTLLYIALLAGFVAFFEILGFIVTSFAFLVLLMILLGVAPAKSVAFSLVFVAVIYLLFGKLFTIGLPAGILGFLEL